ncbi:MAG: shikimate kinase [Clostridia bacterium]|nr:shikimate kinase [Clostridia bacterium]
MSIREHIFLVGMAGCGKTSLGSRAAQHLGVPYVDTDQRLSEIMGMSVNDIYAALGEEFFRNAETAVLAELAGLTPAVISTGEGTVLTEDNITIMRNHGTIIFVDRPLDQILSDIKMDRRPTLRGGTHEVVIEQYGQRIGFYRSAADYRFDNSRGFVYGLSGLIELINSIQASYNELPVLQGGLCL